jgi:hypothetical protein
MPRSGGVDADFKAGLLGSSATVNDLYRPGNGSRWR